MDNKSSVDPNLLQETMAFFFGLLRESKYLFLGSLYSDNFSLEGGLQQHFQPMYSV